MTGQRARTILSSFTFQASQKNLERTIFAPTQWPGTAQSFELLRAVWKNRRKATVLLVEGVVPQMWVAVVQKYLPGCRMRVMVTECLWDREPSTFRGNLKAAIMRWMIRNVDLCILYATADVTRFANYFRILQSKFAVVHFHETLRPERFPTVPAKADYIFAGGNSDRDYSSLVEAMRKIDALCLIACGPPAISGIKLPPNVFRVEANPLQFRQLMASAAIVVVPMREGTLRSAGQQTMLNAMKLGKLVIVTDPAGAADYIVNGDTGVLCTPAMLEATLRKFVSDPETTRQIGVKASNAANAFTVERCYDTICELATDLVGTTKEDEGNEVSNVQTMHDRVGNPD